MIESGAAGAINFLPNKIETCYIADAYNIQYFL